MKRLQIYLPSIFLVFAGAFMASTLFIFYMISPNLSLKSVASIMTTPIIKVSSENTSSLSSQSTTTSNNSSTANISSVANLGQTAATEVYLSQNEPASENVESAATTAKTAQNTVDSIQQSSSAIEITTKKD
jgi:uncharacterized membrane protein YgaE (UPF0421/DUF939 family)